MPMRLLLEREFQQAGLRFPLNLFETTSAFTALSMLQQNPTRVAMLSIDAAQFCTRFGMTRILPPNLQLRSVPYFMGTRHDSALLGIGRAQVCIPVIKAQ